MLDLSLSSLLKEASAAADDVANPRGSGHGLVLLGEVVKRAAHFKTVSMGDWAAAEQSINAKILDVRKGMPGDPTASSCVDELVDLKRVLEQHATGRRIPRGLQ